MELKEPQDYYPIPEEPEGELIDYDAISKTYKTGTNSIQPFMEVMSELIRMRMEIPSWLIIHL